jgi:hypothetical protein
MPPTQQSKFYYAKVNIIMSCQHCSDDQALTVPYHGTALCLPCIEIERTTDWDKHESDKRQRIAEENEY